MSDYEAQVVDAARPTRSGAIVSLAPSLAFLAANAMWGLVAGMIAASLVSVVAIVYRRSRGRRVGLLLPVSFAYVSLRGVAGVLTGSEDVYFGFGIALSAAVAVGVGATAFTARPVAGLLMPLVTPYRHLSMDHAVYRRVASHVTLGWAIAELTITGWEAWHLSHATAAEFVVLRAVLAWPVMFVVIFFLIFYVRFRLDRYEWMLQRSSMETAD